MSLLLYDQEFISKLISDFQNYCKKMYDSCVSIGSQDNFRGQTSVQEGVPTPSQGHLPNILITFSGKPYKIKEILIRRGREGAGASATVINS